MLSFHPVLLFLWNIALDPLHRFFTPQHRCNIQQRTNHYRLLHPGRHRRFGAEFIMLLRSGMVWYAMGIRLNAWQWA